MVFVILGTQDKPFYRLLKAIDKQIELGNITDDVIVQAGHTKYKSKNMKILDLVSMKEFKKYIKDSDYIITHGGVGSILDSLKANKKVIAIPRLSKYGEHTNDHQEQIVNEFVDNDYILTCHNLDMLDATIKALDVFQPKKYRSNNKKFIKLITDYIDKL